MKIENLMCNSKLVRFVDLKVGDVVLWTNASDNDERFYMVVNGSENHMLVNLEDGECHDCNYQYQNQFKLVDAVLKVRNFANCV